MKKYAICVVVAAVLWGLIGVLVKDLSALGYSSMQLVACRAVVTVLLLGLYLLLTDRKKLRVRLRDLWMFAGTGIVSFAMFNYCYFYTIGSAGLTAAAILLYTSPVFVTVMSALFFKEKLTKNKLIALPLAIAGCVLVSGIGQGGGSLTGTALVTGVLSGFGYGLYSIFGRVALKRYDSMTVTFYTFVFAAAATVPLAQPGAFVALTGSWLTFGKLIALGLFSCVLPYLLYTKGLTGLEASKAAIIACCEPVVAAILGIAAYGEPAGWMRLAGIALVLGAIVVLNLNFGKRKNKQLQ